MITKVLCNILHIVYVICMVFILGIVLMLSTFFEVIGME